MFRPLSRAHSPGGADRLKRRRYHLSCFSIQGQSESRHSHSLCALNADVHTYNQTIDTDYGSLCVGLWCMLLSRPVWQKTYHRRTGPHFAAESMRVKHIAFAAKHTRTSKGDGRPPQPLRLQRLEPLYKCHVPTASYVPLFAVRGTTRYCEEPTVNQANETLSSMYQSIESMEGSALCRLPMPLQTHPPVPGRRDNRQAERVQAGTGAGRGINTRRFHQETAS